MSGLPYLLLAFGVLWATQIAGTWLQTRHYRRVLGHITRTQNDGYVGVGNARSTYGKGVILILVAERDGTVREAHAMRGRTVFARFRPASDLVGLRADALTDAEEGAAALEGGMLAAARTAAGQLLEARERHQTVAAAA
jgi:glucitol operon activator protein